MGIPNSDVISVIYQLLPGFTAAWIFYGLTAHPKASPFERVVQALIFMAVIQAVVIPIRASSIVLGERMGSLGIWTENSSFLLSMVVSAILGVAFSAMSNTNCLHSRLPEWITKRPSHPSQWFTAFNRDKRYVYLHLKGGRRIHGWATYWPDQPDVGHFILQDASWILDDNRRARLHLTERMLIPVDEVTMVEFEKYPEEWTHAVEQHESSVAMLLELQTEVEDDERKEAGTSERINERSDARQGDDAELPTRRAGLAVLPERPAACTADGISESGDSATANITATTTPEKVEDSNGRET